MDPQSSAPQNGPAAGAGDNKMILAILSYISILVIIPYLMARNDPFVKFHIKQGLVLLCLGIVVWILSIMLWPLWMLFQLVNLAILVLAIIGIVNVVQKHEKPLPVVGHLAMHFKI